MKKGFIAGNFDVLHPGYIQLFKECKKQCDLFIVLLHSDPS
ncbi:MAG: adenylyltransferase/cytidyltransferase family protein, partial [Flavobacteriaceae bacterium]